MAGVHERELVGMSIVYDSFTVPRRKKKRFEALGFDPGVDDEAEAYFTRQQSALTGVNSGHASPHVSSRCSYSSSPRSASRSPSHGSPSLPAPSLA